MQLANGDPLALFADSFQSVPPLAADDRFATEVAAKFSLASSPTPKT